ncbi:MAG: ATP synthase F0 subunit C [Peptoniphilaceae bacterium]|nr:ATP synthase F0 subunit C [Peptoniphilaceae bacterium]MDD7543082.1 ATP synthase F0 subunit C [Peptoniphilaceae bacterium]MDY3076504.1 ATP synthase F0 subunit C [Peptoniphilaceae bacterium]MDY5765462.1 ATP synthase F0 subunit C [Peptoniphilaceae bacterium]
MKSMKRTFSIVALVFTLIIGFSALSRPAYAAGDESTKEAAEAVSVSQETAETQANGNVKSFKAIGAAIVIALPAGLGALAMGMGISKSADSIARQPEATGDIRTNLMLGLVFVETAIIYALIVAILIIFVL